MKDTDPLFNVVLLRLGSDLRVQAGDSVTPGLVEAFIRLIERIEALENQGSGPPGASR